MKQEIYKGYIKNYNGTEFGGLNIFKDKLQIEDSEYNLNWRWSKKKKKYYSKLDIERGDIKYMFILLKNEYVLIYELGKSSKTYESIRDYYHKDGIEIEPEFEIPF